MPMVICLKCGTDVPDYVKFCTQCGEPVKLTDADADTVQSPDISETETTPDLQSIADVKPVFAHEPPAITHTPQQMPPQSIQQPATSAQIPPVVPKSKIPPPPGSIEGRVVGTGSFIGFLLLFNIPVIGWIACLITAFTARRRNVRNFARASLVYIVFTIALLIVIYILFTWLVESILIHRTEMTQGPLSDYMRVIRYLRLAQPRDLLELLFS